VEGAGFTVAKEVVLQGQSGVVSIVTVLPGDVRQVREMVPQIHDLMTLSIWSQAGTLTYVMSSSTLSERE
jgi:hypothetical protein